MTSHVWWVSALIKLTFFHRKRSVLWKASLCWIWNISICGISTENFFLKRYDNICIGFGYCDNFALSVRIELGWEFWDVGSSRVPSSTNLQKIKNSHLHANHIKYATPYVTSNNELDQLHGTNRLTDRITLTSNRELNCHVTSGPLREDLNLRPLPHLNQED